MWSVSKGGSRGQKRFFLIVVPISGTGCWRRRRKRNNPGSDLRSLLSFKKGVLKRILACSFLQRAFYFYSKRYASAQGHRSLQQLQIWTLKMSGSMTRYTHRKSLELKKSSPLALAWKVCISSEKCCTTLSSVPKWGGSAAPAYAGAIFFWWYGSFSCRGARFFLAEGFIMGIIIFFLLFRLNGEIFISPHISKN